MIKPEQVALALDLLALLAAEETAALGDDGERLRCPYCGGDQWEWLDGKWWVGHEEKCPIIKARDLMTEIIEGLQT